MLFTDSEEQLAGQDTQNTWTDFVHSVSSEETTSASETDENNKDGKCEYQYKQEEFVNTKLYQT